MIAKVVVNLVGGASFAENNLLAALLIYLLLLHSPLQNNEELVQVDHISVLYAMLFHKHMDILNERACLFNCIIRQNPSSSFAHQMPSIFELSKH